MPSEGELVQGDFAPPSRPRARFPDRIRQDVSRSPATRSISNPGVALRPGWGGWGGGRRRWGYPYAWGVQNYGWSPYGWFPAAQPQIRCFFSRNDDRLNCVGKLYSAEVIQISGNYAQVTAPAVFDGPQWVPLL